MNSKGINVNDITLEALEYFFRGEDEKASFFFAVYEMSKFHGKWLDFYQAHIFLKEVRGYYKQRCLNLDFGTYAAPEIFDKQGVIKFYENGFVLLDGFYETLEAILMVQESLNLGQDMLNPVE
jgi:hypothetical protein